MRAPKSQLETGGNQAAAKRISGLSPAGSAGSSSTGSDSNNVDTTKMNLKLVRCSLVAWGFSQTDVSTDGIGHRPPKDRTLVPLASHLGGQAPSNLPVQRSLRRTLTQYLAGGAQGFSIATNVAFSIM